MADELHIAYIYTYYRRVDVFLGPLVFALPDELHIAYPYYRRANIFLGPIVFALPDELHIAYPYYRRVNLFLGLEPRPSYRYFRVLTRLYIYSI